MLEAEIAISTYSTSPTLDTQITLPAISPDDEIEVVPPVRPEQYVIPAYSIRTLDT